MTFGREQHLQGTQREEQLCICAYLPNLVVYNIYKRAPQVTFGKLRKNFSNERREENNCVSWVYTRGLYISAEENSSKDRREKNNCVSYWLFASHNLD